MPESSVQEFILELNAERKVGLRDLLYCYGKVNVDRGVHKVRVLDINTKSIDIHFYDESLQADVDKLIVFEPELSSLSQIRGRLEAMMAESAEKRGYSPFQITEVIYPNSIVDWLVIGGVALPLLCYSFRPLLYLLPLPSVIINYLDNDKVLIGMMILEVAIHFLETYFILRPKLHYYRVPTDSLIEWYFLGMIEGYAPGKRLNAFVTKQYKTQ